MKYDAAVARIVHSRLMLAPLLRCLCISASESPACLSHRWLQLGIELAYLIPIATAEFGFEFHHETWTIARLAAHSLVT